MAKQSRRRPGVGSKKNASASPAEAWDEPTEGRYMHRGYATAG